ncbi:MAG: HAMP domain-containing histidine kinase [Bdellovibrionales bacterium]|nr:HAMP domain-containing histidine kinase [Bdellovibrionales bacterium]
MKPAKEIVWITDAPNTRDPLMNALRHGGYSVRCVAPPDEFKFAKYIGYSVRLIKAPKASDLGGWIEQNFSPDTVALIVEGGNLSRLDLLATSLRKQTSLQWRFLPLFWGYETLDAQLLDRVVGIGINEIFCRSGGPAELVARLNLRIQHAAEMRRLQKEMDSLQKQDAAAETALKQREEFLGVCAHDLRSPIGVIQSGLSSILEGTHSSGLSPFVAEVLSRSYRQAGHALRLVNDLLDVMSYEQGLRPKYGLFNLHEFLKEFYEDYRSQAEERGIQFQYENPIPEWRVLADSDRVRQLLQNLLANALKFTDSGKTIHLSVTPFKGRRRNDPPYEMVVLSLRDEGKGIPPKEIEKIFDRFSQIKDYSRAGGRGLGLTVAKQISNLHAGNLWVESREGEGSVFHVLLPHVIGSKLARRSHTRPTILIVEPVEEKRKPYFAALTDKGFDVHYVKDGVEAVAMSFYLRPDFAILRHDTHKMGEDEVAEILQSNEITRGIALYVGLDPGESRDKSSVRDEWVKGFISLPLTEDFLAEISSEKPKRSKKKKAA